MLSELQSWVEDLPLHLKPGAPIASTHLRAVSFLHLRYNQCVVLITRNYLLRSREQLCPLAAECEAANLRSILILKTLQSHSLLSQINYLDGMHILSNGMILLLRATRWPTAMMSMELEDYVPVLQTTRQLRIGQLAIDYMNFFVENLRAVLSSQR